MNAQKDEEIQDWLDKGGKGIVNDASPVDVESYRLLFEKLKQAPLVELADNFSSRLMTRLREKEYRKSNRRFYLLTVLLFVTGFALAYGFTLTMNQEQAKQLLTVAWNYKWICVLVLICILLSLRLENNLIKNNYRREYDRIN